MRPTMRTQVPRVGIPCDQVQHGLAGFVDERLVPERSGEQFQGLSLALRSNYQEILGSCLAVPGLVDDDFGRKLWPKDGRQPNCQSPILWSNLGVFARFKPSKFLSEHHNGVQSHSNSGLGIQHSVNYINDQESNQLCVFFACCRLGSALRGSSPANGLQDMSQPRSTFPAHTPMKRDDVSTPRGKTFIAAMLHGISSVGLLYPRQFEPIRYSRPYDCDLKVIGSDMWRAVERYRHEQESEAA